MNIQTNMALYHTRSNSPVSGEQKNNEKPSGQQNLDRPLSFSEKDQIKNILSSIKFVIRYIEGQAVPMEKIRQSIQRKIIGNLKFLSVEISNQLAELPSTELLSALGSISQDLSDTIETEKISPSSMSEKINTFIRELLSRNLPETHKVRANSDSSSEYEYDENTPLFESGIPSGKVSLHIGRATHGVLSVNSSDENSGFGFILKYVPDIQDGPKDWIQFISRQILLNGTPVEGENRFKMNQPYELFIDKQNRTKTYWGLDSNSKSPFYADSLKSLPEEGGSRPIFDQPTGWSASFFFRNIPELNSTEGIVSLLQSGQSIQSIAEFKSYLCTPELESLGAFSFKVSWNISLENIVRKGTAFVVKAPFNKGTIRGEDVKFESCSLDECHRLLIDETC